MAKFRISPEQLKSLTSKRRPNKFGAKPVIHDGWRFASIKEGSYYLTLKMRKRMGEVSYFLCQVPFRLPGKIKYIADFMVVYPDNRIEFIDVKGLDTRISIMKRSQVEELYGVEIKIV